LRREILEDIHKGHLGITKCHERAKLTVYWPGYQGQITDMIEGCTPCQENMRANDKTILEPFEIPSYPMQTISMDLFHHDGKEYFLTIDRYSKWPSCYEIKQSTSKNIIDILKRQFLDFGTPESCICDNASYFTSFEFKSYMEVAGVKLITVSPYTSRSNGLAERTIQTVKSCLTKSHQTGQTLFDVIKALRTTPIGSGLPAPSVLLQGRNLRDNLNFNPTQLRIQSIDHKAVEKALRKRQSNIINNTTKPTKFQFIEGMSIWVKTGHRHWSEGKVIGHAQTPRSYFVEVNGKVVRRNQTDLRSRNANLQSREPIVYDINKGFNSSEPRRMGANQTGIIPNAPDQVKPSADPTGWRRSSRITRSPDKLNYSKLGGT
jgi:hypothetical protein